jgi:hypothetical protein
VALRLGRRREREPAVTHDHGGHAVVARERSEGIPEDLRVHVGVAVDEARRDDVPVGVDVLGTSFANAPDGGDAVADDADVGAIGVEAGPVDDGAVADHEVIGHLSSPVRACRVRSCG